MEKVCFCADCGHRSILALPYCIIMHALPHCDMPFPFQHTHTLFCIRRWSTTESCLLFVGCHQNKKYKYKIKNRSFWIERHAWWKSGLDFAAVAVVRRFNGYSICCWLSAKVSSSAFGARHTWCNILDLDSSLVWESIIIICDTHFCSDSIACRRALQEFLIRAANHHRKKNKSKTNSIWSILSMYDAFEMSTTQRIFVSVGWGMRGNSNYFFNLHCVPNIVHFSLVGVTLTSSRHHRTK